GRFADNPRDRSRKQVESLLNRSRNQSIRYLFLQEGSHSRFIGHREPIAGFQARVCVPCVASQRTFGMTRALILLQNEDSLLPLLELVPILPSHVPGLRKADNHL